MAQPLWLFSATHNSPCKVLNEHTLWGQPVCRVWLPNQNKVAWVAASSLKSLPMNTDSNREAARIAYLASAAKVAQALEGSTADEDSAVLLAPMESNVIPLPHQLHILSRAMSGDRVRYLLADEVGLGKTVEAGLIMRELKLRGLVRRTLVVVPKGLATQWVAEMETHFNEPFQLVSGQDIDTLHRMAAASREADSGWTLFDQVVVSQDSVKPVDRRRGWSGEQIAAYNRDRFEGLITAGWDLIIVDEAHRLGGSTDQVARHRLGKGLADAAPCVLLLSATPHQGKSDAFRRLLSLLDETAFPDEFSVSRERVAPYVLRTEKRKAIDADGNPLFKPRRTQMVAVEWQSRHRYQEALYETVTEYVREGYNRALREKKRHIGFLMVLMQRLVTSSIRAIRTTLEKRLAMLEGKSDLEELVRVINSESRGLSADEWEDMDGQEQLEALQALHAGYATEIAEVQALLAAAVRCEQAGPDAKAEALIEWIYKLQSEENDADLKLLIFTEFVPTQQMLRDFLETRGFAVVVLNGSMDMAARKQAQNAFRDTHRILISTDAGGEGLNLQFAHVVVNYDMPWNPMRLEQRIGRVDRIGQSKPVRAINFVFKNSVEFRVREVLEEKLAVIFDEFGVDKTGDVLDSAHAGEIFEEMFTSALLDPGAAEKSVNETVSQIRDEIQQARATSTLFGASAEPDVKAAERLRTHPLPHWVERMTVNYLRFSGGRADARRSWWDVVWPDGEAQQKCVFRAQDAIRLTGANLLGLEDARIRQLVNHLPCTVPGQAIPRVWIDGLPPEISGHWGLFEICLQPGLHEAASELRLPRVRRGYVCVFVNAQGDLLLPTARRIWDLLLTTDPIMKGNETVTDVQETFKQLQMAAEQAGEDVFWSLHHAHIDSMRREEERGRAAFAARRRAIARVGLPEVREYRLSQCDAVEGRWRAQLKMARQTVPQLRPLLMLHVCRRAGQ